MVSAEAPLTQTLQEKQEYLNLLKTTTDEDTFGAASDVQVNELLTLIRSASTVSVTQATQFLKDLGTGPLPEEHKKHWRSH